MWNPKWIYSLSFFHRGTWTCTDYWNLEVWWPQFTEGGTFRTMAKHLMASKELICSSSTAWIYTGSTTNRPEFFCLCSNTKAFPEDDFFFFLNQTTAVKILTVRYTGIKGGTIHCISLSKFRHNLPLKKNKHICQVA